MRNEFRYGKKIRQLREARAWTQEQLALAADIETRTIQRVEKDLTKSPETLQAIAGAFDVDLDSLRSTWLIPESRLLRMSFLTNYQQFVRVEESHSSHAFGRMIMAPLTEEALKQVKRLVEQIFSDRELIEPYETDLWSSYLEQIEGPLKELFDLNLAISVLDEQKDLLVRNDGTLKLEKPYIDDWCVRYFLFVPRHGCFRLDSAEPLHRFDANCSDASDAIFHAITQREIPGIQVVANAFAAIGEPDFFGSGINWCDRCFPILEDSSRLNFDYIERVTGLDRAKLYSLWQESTGEGFLQGLA